MVSSQPPSRDTVPFKTNKLTVCCLLTCNEKLRIAAQSFLQDGLRAFSVVWHLIIVTNCD
jgi:hypothetical protein